MQAITKMQNVLMPNGVSIIVGLLKNVYQNKSNILYIKGLDPEVNDLTLQAAFESYGLISSVHVVSNGDGRCRGFGFISFFNQADAEKAANEMNRKLILGKLVTITFAQKKYDR